MAVPLRPSWRLAYRHPGTFGVEHAHRIPMTPGPPRSPPRTFIMKLLNYRDRNNILLLTRELGHLTIQNSNISVFLDFSINIQKEKTKFKETL